jgi:hypothetical protein
VIVPMCKRFLIDRRKSQSLARRRHQRHFHQFFGVKLIASLAALISTSLGAVAFQATAFPNGASNNPRPPSVAASVNEAPREIAPVEFARFTYRLITVTSTARHAHLARKRPSKPQGAEGASVSNLLSKALATYGPIVMWLIKELSEYGPTFACTLACLTIGLCC